MKKFLLAATTLTGLVFASPAFAQAQQQCVTNAVASGTADAITVPLLPCGLSTNILILTITANNTTTTPTLQMAGFPALPIYTNTLAAPGIGDFGTAGSVLMLTSTGSSWLIINGNVGGFIPLPLSVANGGTGDTTLTANGVLYGNGTSAVGVTTAGTTGQYFAGNTGSAPGWSTLASGLVTTLSFGSTGLTPSSATSGAITVAGTLATGSGGTGLTGYTAGDLIYASGAATLSKLAASTSATLLHGGTAPSWSAVSLTADVSGLLSVANGGTGAGTFTSHGLVLGNGTSPFGVTGAGTTGQLLVGVTGADPVWTSVPSSGVSTISFFGTGLTPATPTGGVVSVGGVLNTLSGGTGQVGYTDGQLLIGNTVTGSLNRASLTAGTGIAITPGNGSISISTSGGGFGAITAKTVAFNATANAGFCVDTVTSGAVTATLPASPTNNDEIDFVNCSSWAANAFTVARNGNNIQGLAQDLTVQTTNGPFALIFVTSYGWRFKW